MDFQKYISLLSKKTKKLPIYRVKVEGEDQFLYTDDELADVIKRYEKWKGKEVDIGEAEKKVDSKASITKELDLVEFFESDEFLETVNKIEKLDIGIEQTLLKKLHLPKQN